MEPDPDQMPSLLDFVAFMTASNVKAKIPDSYGAAIRERPMEIWITPAQFQMVKDLIPKGMEVNIAIKDDVPDLPKAVPR